MSSNKDIAALRVNEEYYGVLWSTREYQGVPGSTMVRIPVVSQPFLVPLGPGMCGETDRGARRDKA